MDIKVGNLLKCKKTFSAGYVEIKKDSILKVVCLNDGYKDISVDYNGFIIYVKKSKLNDKYLINWSLTSYELKQLNNFE
jgi:hypothetical protein